MKYKTFTSFLLLSILLTILLEIKAQTTVSYSYDATGNRILREIVMQKSQLNAAEDNSTVTDANVTENKIYKDSTDNIKIDIYPNPTQGLLRIDINGYDFRGNSTIYLYNVSGNLLLKKLAAINSNLVDISNYSNGTYILKIVLNDYISEWKIIKK